VSGAVQRKRVLAALDAENALVRAEVDFDHHVLLRQLLEQGRGVVFVHHVDAVADALGVSQLDRLADVEAQALGRDQAGSQLAGVQADVDLGINGVEIVEHPHLQRVVAHGNEAVLGLHEVDADEAGLMLASMVCWMVSKPSRVWAKTCSGAKPRRTW
jgi:hypothetical protein